MIHGRHGGQRKAFHCPHEDCKRNKGKGFSREENLQEHLRRIHQTEASRDLHRTSSRNSAAGSSHSQSSFASRPSQASYKKTEGVGQVLQFMRDRAHKREASRDLHRTSSRNSAAGSSHSQSSFASDASQASYEKKDEFDQVLQSMRDRLAAQVRLLKQKRPNVISISSTGKVRRADYTQASKELKQFHDLLRRHFGMADTVRRKDHFSSQYSRVRGKLASF